MSIYPYSLNALDHSSRETNLVHDTLMNFRSETSIVHDVIMKQHKAEEELKKATFVATQSFYGTAKLKDSQTSLLHSTKAHLLGNNLGIFQNLK